MIAKFTLVDKKMAQGCLLPWANVEHGDQKPDGNVFASVQLLLLEVDS